MYNPARGVVVVEIHASTTRSIVVSIPGIYMYRKPYDVHYARPVVLVLVHLSERRFLLKTPMLLPYAVANSVFGRNSCRHGSHCNTF